MEAVKNNIKMAIPSFSIGQSPPWETDPIAMDNFREGGDYNHRKPGCEDCLFLFQFEIFLYYNFFYLCLIRI